MRCASGPVPAPRRRRPGGSRGPRAGSGRAAPRSIRPPHDQVSRRIDLGPAFGTEDDRRFPLLDDRRASEDRAGVEAVTVVDGHLCETSIFGQVDLSGTFLRLVGGTRVTLLAAEPYLRAWRDDLETPGERLQRNVRPLAVVQPPVLFPVERRQAVGVVGVEPAVGQLHRYLVPLAGISHLAEAAYPDIRVADAGCAQESAALRLQALQRPVHLRPVELVQAAVEAAHEVEGQRRAQEAEGRRGTRA